MKNNLGLNNVFWKIFIIKIFDYIHKLIYNKINGKRIDNIVFCNISSSILCTLYVYGIKVRGLPHIYAKIVHRTNYNNTGPSERTQFTIF